MPHQCDKYYLAHNLQDHKLSIIYNESLRYLHFCHIRLKIPLLQQNNTIVFITKYS